MAEKYLSRKALLEREGWSKQAINKLLGEPDKLIESENAKRPKQRFLLKKVETIEAEGKLKAFIERRAKRAVQE